MTGDIDDMPFGERLRTIRERGGLSRQVLAGLVGRSASWLKKIETGENGIPDLYMLARLARTLRLTKLDDLVGPLEIPTFLDVRPDRTDDVRAFRQALTMWPVPASEPVSGAELRQRVRAAWTLWHANAAPRAATGRILPELILDGRIAMARLDGPERRRAAAAMVECYTLTGHWLAWIADGALLRIIADRAMQAAQDADDPHALGEAAWQFGNVMRYVDSDETISVVERAARPLRAAMDADSATDDQAALYGSLMLHQAITHAQRGRAGDAERHLDLAGPVAEELPRGFQHPMTVFAPWNVNIHHVSVLAELSSGSDGALAVDPETVPGPYRRSRLWLDSARALYTSGDQLGALRGLQRATETCAENMKHSPPARTLAGNLVDRGGPMIQAEARAVARELDVIV